MSCRLGILFARCHRLPVVYDASGTERPGGTAIGNPYLFNGRRWDGESRLYYYRTRYMDPGAGRFITRDSIGIWGDAANLGNGYTYAGSNPRGRLDPAGEQWTPIGARAQSRVRMEYATSPETARWQHQQALRRQIAESQQNRSNPSINVTGTSYYVPNPFHSAGRVAFVIQNEMNTIVAVNAAGLVPGVGDVQDGVGAVAGTEFDPVTKRFRKLGVWERIGYGAGLLAGSGKLWNKGFGKLKKLFTKCDDVPSPTDIKYHYTNAPEGSFKDGLWSHSSVTDNPNSSPREAMEQLGVKSPPDKIIPVRDGGNFVPNSPPIVEPHPLGPGGGTDFFNPNTVSGEDILPAIPIDPGGS